MNIAKESGVGRSEIEANNIDTKAKCSIWLETIREGLEEVKNIFGLDITVNLRFNNEMGDIINE